MKLPFGILPNSSTSLWVVVIPLIYLLFSHQLAAQEQNKSIIPVLERVPYAEVKSGRLYFKTADGYFSGLNQQSDYQVEVNGLLARVRFSQTFKNTSKQFLDAVYVFPLIDDAAVDSMVMEIGERKIVGKIKEKQQAKRLYLQAKRQGKKASLVSQQRPNMFTTKVSNIAPGEHIKITISYLQSVTYYDDEFSLRIPLTITPRYLPKAAIDNISKDDNHELHHGLSNTTQISRSGWGNISPPQTRNSRGQKVNINIELNTGLLLTNITSRYHQIVKQKQNNHTLVSLANKRVLLDRDFVLTWQVAQGSAPKTAFFQMADSHFNYGLLMIMPPTASQGKTIVKNVTYILDTSGSMGGVAIKQAKQALAAGLALLHERDAFNIIAFNNTTQTLFVQNRTASAKNIALAQQWLIKRRAGGGTNMYPAIKQALQASHSNFQNAGAEQVKYQQVVFITDGSVANEQALFTLIENNLGNTRLHTIGIGSAPNSYFMSRAAESGRGTYRYIGNINEVSVEMDKLFSDISKPMMSNIKLKWPVEHIESYPLLIPDLYQYQPMMISARWPKGEQTTNKALIEVTGQLADSNWHERIHIVTHSAIDANNESNQGIAQWWARQKIKQLSQQHRRSNKLEKLHLKQQITDLALHHHLVSNYTSFIAVEEKISRSKSSKVMTKAVANLMPKGSTQMIPMANTALGVMGYFYIGLVLLIVSLLLQLTWCKSKVSCHRLN